MAKKKEYHIPTIEIIPMQPGWPVLIADSNDHGSVHHVPMRREKAF